MRMAEVHNYAKRMMEIHGDKAEVVVAKKIREYVNEGNEVEAKIWTRIRATIKEMRGPHAS